MAVNLAVERSRPVAIIESGVDRSETYGQHLSLQLLLVRSCDVRDMLLSASNCFQHVRRIDSRPCHSARVLRRWPSHPALVPQAPVSSNNAHHWSGAHARRGRQRRPPPGTDRVIPSEIILGPAQPTEPRSGGPFAAGKGHTCANPNLRYARLLPKHQLQSSVRAVVACRDCHAKSS